MALKPCRECKKKVSTEATACPSCGAPKPTTLDKKISSLKAIGLEVKKSNQLKKMAMTICCSNVHCSVWADAVEVPTKPSLKNYKCPRCNSQMIDHNEEKIEEMASKARPWGETGRGGWSKDYLEAQRNLRESHEETKTFKDPSEWDEIYEKREEENKTKNMNIDKDKEKKKGFNPFFFIPDNAFGGFLILLFFTWLIFGVIFDIGTDLGPPRFFGDGG